MTEQASEAQDQSYSAQDPIVKDVVGENAQDVTTASGAKVVVDAVSNKVDEVVKVAHDDVDGGEVAKNVGATDE
ncbi:hypothetical protein Dimus_025044, partial [Dionaea muscipula]